MLKFFKCEVCKNIIIKLADSGVPVSCCGKPMAELVPGATDGALEKHVPSVAADGKNVKVQIGEVLHPMLEEHFIQFIALETKNGFQVKSLKAGDEPKAEFTVAADDEAVAVYEYCNLHGLWVKEL